MDNDLIIGRADNSLKELDTKIDRTKKELKKLKEQRADYVKAHERASKIPTDYLRISDGNEEYVFFIKKIDYTTDGKVFSLTGSGISISGNACFKKESVIYRHELQKFDVQYITFEEYNKSFEKGIELIRTQNFSK